MKQIDDAMEALERAGLERWPPGTVITACYRLAAKLLFLDLKSLIQETTEGHPERAAGLRKTWKDNIPKDALRAWEWAVEKFGD
jgi:hypothetical protein